MALWLDYGLDERLFLLLSHVYDLYMRVNCIILNYILPNLWTSPFELQVLFKAAKFLLVGLVLFKVHIFSQYNIFGNLSSNFIEVAIIE